MSARYIATNEYIQSARDAVAEMKAAGPDDVEEAIYERADELVEVYTGVLLCWYADNLSRIGYADDALMESSGDGTFIDLLMTGQAMFWRELMREVYEIEY